MENFIQDYINYASEFTDAPEIFLKYGAYSALSAAISNKIYFEFGDQHIYPNLWIIFMAPSSLYRKTTAVNIVRRLLTSANLDVVLPNEFSQESLVELLSTQPSGIFFFSEFMSLATSLDKEYMLSAKSFLTDIFDSSGHPYKRKTKSGEFIIVNPCISILAATTIDWFLDRIKERDLYGGFLTRFIFVPWDKPKERSYSFSHPADYQKRQALAFFLEQLSQKKAMVKFGEEAIVVHDKWYERNCVMDIDKVNGVLGSFINRLQMYLLKVSVLEQVASALPESNLVLIGKDAMINAVETANFLRVSIERLCGEELTFDRYQASRKKVLKEITHRKSEGIARSELFTITRLPKRELEEVIQSLIEEGKIYEETLDREGEVGRRKTRYFIKV